MISAKASIIVLACTAAVAATQAPSETPTFKVAVDAVSIDAVVTDRHGKVVRDLTAPDFEVLQDGKRQKVTLAAFVPVTTAAAPAASAVGPRSFPAPTAREIPPVAVPPLTRGQVRRTIVVVVDDLGLSVQGMNDTRLALRRFAEAGLLPTDLVAIVRTGESNGLLQSLTNDRGALNAAIDALRYNICSRKGMMTSGGDVNQLGGGSPEIEEVGLQCMIPTAASLAALNLVVQGAREMPGRKTVIFASEGFGRLDLGTHPTTVSNRDKRSVRDALDRAIDQAARSGVVIYAIDGQGLQPGGLRASDNVYSADTSQNTDAMSGLVRRLAADRQRAILDAQQTLVYLAEQTGGFAVLNTNDLAAAFSRVSGDVRDYYVIGYEPDEDTFAPEGKPPRRHTITVQVKRAGVRVRARKAFIGVSDRERPSEPPTAAEALVHAAVSPFSIATIPLHATNLPAYSPGRGMFVRTVLHIDAHALTFSTGAGGTRTATVDLVGLVFNTDGAQVQQISTGFDVTLENAAGEQATKHGLVYTARVPIEKPGSYQLRYAVRDRRSGAIGSAGASVNLANVTGGAFALSGLVLRAGEPTVASPSIDSDRFSVRPVDALRVYAPGTPLSYSYEIYNARTTVRAVTSLWRDTQMVMALPPDTWLPSADGNPLRASGNLELDAELRPGTYVLQIAATSDDPTHAKRTRAAVQRLSFDVK